MKIKLNPQCYTKFSTWDNSRSLRFLYQRRCRRMEKEMDCHRQAAEILRPHFDPGDSVLDVGCGSGYFFHSLSARFPKFTYAGLDPSESLLRIGRKEMTKYGLPASHLVCGRMEDCEAWADHVVCINVLTYLENFQKVLERCLSSARKTVLIRESIWARPSRFLFVVDEFLDPPKRLRVHVNTYNRWELGRLATELGFRSRLIVDQRSGGKPETSIGYPHHWAFMIFQKKP